LAQVLPAAAASPLAAVAAGVEQLAELRLMACSPEQVRAVAEAWERLSAQVTAGQWAVLAALDERDDVIPVKRPGFRRGSVRWEGWSRGTSEQVVGGCSCSSCPHGRRGHARA
jgi:hypothetical protein